MSTRTNVLLTFLPLFFLKPDVSHSQYAIFTYSCDTVMANCDTILAEYYDKAGRLNRKVNLKEGRNFITYEYDSTGRLTGKKHRQPDWTLVKYEKYYFTGGNEKWTHDSIFGKTNELLMVLTRQQTLDPGSYLVNWFFRKEASPMTTQIIKEDGQGHELSNSTCYAPDNCITYINRYNQDRKIFVELWVLSPESGSSPILKESEELVYDANGQLTARVRFKEPEHIILERNRYERIEGLLPYKKY